MVLVYIYDISFKNPLFLGINIKREDTLYFSPCINEGIQKKNVPPDPGIAVLSSKARNDGEIDSRFRGNDIRRNRNDIRRNRNDIKGS